MSNDKTSDTAVQDKEEEPRLILLPTYWTLAMNH